MMFTYYSAMKTKGQCQKHHSIRVALLKVQKLLFASYGIPICNNGWDDYFAILKVVITENALQCYNC